MIRRDLDPSAQQVAAALAARLEAARGGVPGVMAGGGDVSAPQDTDTGETTSGGGIVGRRGPAASLRDVGRKVERVESVVKNLQAGVSTQGRWNTVSTSDAPSSADGYPDGAWWTKVASEDSLIPVAVWTVTGGKWETRPLPAGQMVAPVMDTGLISAGSVAAAIIRSDEFWTALTGQRVGFNREGFQAYNQYGQQTVRLDGVDNLLMGTLRAGEATITSWAQGASYAAGVLFGTFDPSRADEVPRVLGSWPDKDSGADLILASGHKKDAQGVLQFSHAAGKVALTQQDGPAKAGLTLRTDTQSYLGGYSKQENNSSGIQFGNGWIDFIGKLGTKLTGSMVRVGIVQFGHMATGSIYRVDVKPDGGGQVKPGYKWLPIVVVYDWGDGGQFVPKVTSADDAGFRVVTECTAGGSDNAGFIYLAVRVDEW